MIKFVLRVLCLPLVAICHIIKWLAMLTTKCGCYIGSAEKVVKQLEGLE